MMSFLSEDVDASLVVYGLQKHINSFLLFTQSYGLPEPSMESSQADSILPFNKKCWMKSVLGGFNRSFGMPVDQCKR